MGAIRSWEITSTVVVTISVVIDLTESAIFWKICLWPCLWEVIEIMLIEMRRPVCCSLHYSLARILNKCEEKELYTVIILLSDCRCDVSSCSKLL